MLKNAQSRDVTLYVVEGGFHEVMMGTEKEDVTQHIIDWVHQQAAHQAAAPAAHSAQTESSAHTAECSGEAGPAAGSLDAAPSLSSDESDMSSTLAEQETQPQQQELPPLRAGLGPAGSAASSRLLTAPSTEVAPLQS